MGLILNFIAGSGLKIIASAVGKWMEIRREQLHLIANTPIEKLKALQSGQDTLSAGGKATRRYLAIHVIWIWTVIVVGVLIFKTDLTVLKEVAQTPSLLWGWVFPSKNVTTMMVSPFAILLTGTLDFCSFVMGFYFTKISKGG